MATIVQRPGRKALYLVYRQAGRQVWRALPKEMTRTAARDMARETEALLRGRQATARVEEILSEVGRPATQVRAPVAELWALYEQAPQPRRQKERTVRSKQALVGAWVRWMAERHPEVVCLHEVTPRLAAKYMGALAHLAGQTRNNHLSALHDTFATVRVQAGLHENVWEAVQRVERQSVRHEAFTVEQVKKLVRAAQELPARVAEFWPAAIALAWHTGLRFGDVCTLDWTEVDLAAGTVTVHPEKGWKGDRVVRFALHADYRAYLERAAAATGQQGFVWPEIADAYRRQAGAVRWLYAEWDALCAKIGIEETRRAGRKVWGFHSLRHGFVSASLAGGAALEAVQQAVGHGSPQMTAHYSHNSGGIEAGKHVPALGTCFPDPLVNPKASQQMLPTRLLS